MALSELYSLRCQRARPRRTVGFSAMFSTVSAYTSKRSQYGMAWVGLGTKDGQHRDLLVGLEGEVQRYTDDGVHGGAGYFDQVLLGVIAGKSTTTSLTACTKSGQFSS